MCLSDERHAVIIHKRGVGNMPSGEPEPIKITWRTFLGDALKNEVVRERLRELVTDRTWTRYVNGETTPSPHLFPVIAGNLPHEMRAKFIQLVKQSFPEIVFPSQSDEYGIHIPQAFLIKMMESYAVTARSLQRFTGTRLPAQQLEAILYSQWHEPCDIVLASLISHRHVEFESFSPSKIGITYGTIQEPTLEWLSMNVCKTAKETIINDVLNTLYSFHEKIGSIAIFPILRSGDVAGALICTSLRKNFFDAEKTELLSRYALFFALAYRDKDFIAPDTIVIPEERLLTVQAERLAQIQTRYVNDVRSYMILHNVGIEEAEEAVFHAIFGGNHE